MSLQPSSGYPASAAVTPPCAPQDAGDLAARQRALVLAAVARLALKGKEVGLLCDDPSQPEALVAYRAAIELGAHVALVRPRFAELGEPDAILEAARMLGRLYDGLACVAIPGAVVEQLRAFAGVPVIVEPAAGLPLAGALQRTAAEADRQQPWQAAFVSAFAAA